jgi:hypothetical protein
MMYRSGRGVAQNHSEAARWARKAAVQGHAGAQYNFAVMYLNGEGVAQNHSKAAHWMRKSADQGDIDAQFCFAVMHRNGQGVPRDDIEALRLTRKAAEKGLATAQYDLGVLYRYGDGGVAQDYSEAARWARKAAAQGHTDAIALMSDIAVSISPDSKKQAPRSSVASTRQQCILCGRGCEDGLKLRPCSRCKLAVYCGEECQRAHWKAGHKTKCSSKK